MTTIENKEDWDWYKQRLDVDGKYNHRHNGSPKQYPCKVESEWNDDPNGPYYFNHRFFYQKDIVCEKCQHKTKEWDIDNE